MSRPIACKDAIRRLWDYLDGAIDEHEQDRVEAHLTFCLRCCGELEFARELREVLRVRTATPIPDGARQRLESFVDRLDDPRDEGPPRRDHD